MKEPLNYRGDNAPYAAPHFVNLVRAELEATYPPDLIYQSGLKIVTTLDSNLQDVAEAEIRQQIDALSNRNVTNGALVALETETGKVLALVGSKDFRDDAIAGQINMALNPRQPGSTIKPLVYLTAFEQGWTASHLLMDVPTEYPDGAGNVYKPKNYDEKFHGPVSIRSALANSYNIPVVKALEQVGLTDFAEMSQRLGISTLPTDQKRTFKKLWPLSLLGGRRSAFARNGGGLSSYGQ